MHLRKNRPNEFNAIYLFLGLLLGFFLGSSVVYWHRHNDKVILEAVDKLITVFSEASHREGNQAELSVAKVGETLPESAGSPNNSLLTEALPEPIDAEAHNINDLPLQEETTRDNIVNPEEIPTTTAFRKAIQQDRTAGNFNMANDRLLHTRTIAVALPDNKQSDADKRMDSLLEYKAAPAHEQIFFIEFWESPLNSLVYRMGKSKIEFYGVRQYNLAGIHYLRGKFYLEYLNNAYPLEYTTSFKPLLPADDIIFPEEIQDI